MYYLNVPFAEKDLAKVHGAKCDLVKKSWYVPDDKLKHIKHFKRWDPAVLFLDIADCPKPKKKAKRSKQVLETVINGIRYGKPKQTGSVFNKFCECISPPWEHCQHTNTTNLG